jgi:hypothetical protein
MKNPLALKPLSLKALSELFVASSNARKLASKQLDPELGNEHFDMMANIYRELKSRGIDAQRSLLPLLDHGDPDVRCNAAALALEFAPSLAEPVLQSLRELHGFVGYDAGSILREWKAGRLQFPPYAHAMDDE